MNIEEADPAAAILAAAPVHRPRPGQRLQPVPARRRPPGLARLARRPATPSATTATSPLECRLTGDPRRRPSAPIPALPAQDAARDRPARTPTARRRRRPTAGAPRCGRGRRVLLDNWTAPHTVPSRTALPAPVELGLGVHRDRPAPPVARAAPSGSWRRCSARSGPTAGSRTSSSTRPCPPTPTSPAPTSGAPARSAAGAPAGPDLRHRAAAGPRAAPPGWCTAPTRPSHARRGFLRPALPAAGRLARLPAPTAATSAARAGRRRAPLGVRAWTTAPAWDGPLRRVTPAPAGLVPRAATSPTAPPPTGPPTWTTGATSGSPRDYRDHGYADARGAHASPWRTRCSTRCSSPASTRSPTIAAVIGADPAGTGPRARGSPPR